MENPPPQKVAKEISPSENVHKCSVWNLHADHRLWYKHDPWHGPGTEGPAYRKKYCMTMDCQNSWWPAIPDRNSQYWDAVHCWECKNKQAAECVKLDLDAAEFRRQLAEKNIPLAKVQPEDMPNSLKKKPFYLITVNPSNDVDPGKFFEYINTYMHTSEETKDQRYVYSFEQRGESTDDIHGYHCHILIEKKQQRPDNMYMNLRRTLLRREWIGDAKHVDVKHISTQDLPNVVNYIVGTKSDHEKQAKQICDVIMRKKYNLEPFYKNEMKI